MGHKESKNSKIEKKYGNGLSISQEHAEYLGPPAVIDHLVLGSSFDAGNRKLLDELNVRWILNVAEEAARPINDSAFKYLKLIVEDSMPEGKDQFDVFEKAFDFIDDSKKKNQRCIIHCMRGRSRSASIVIAYLMKRRGITLKEAYSIVKKERPAIGPHHFMKVQLVQYEKHLFGKNTMIDYHTWALEENK